MSVHVYRLMMARAKAAETRNKNPRCHCQIEVHPPEWHSKRRQGKRQLNTQHGALHGVFGNRGCPHSDMARTTKGVLHLVRPRKQIATLIFR